MYTYNRKFFAKLGRWPHGELGTVVTVPDQVADDQTGYWERAQSFPARLDDGGIVICRVDGSATGLDSEIGGIGDLVVTANPSDELQERADLLEYITSENGDQTNWTPLEELQERARLLSYISTEDVTDADWTDLDELRERAALLRQISEATHAGVE